MRITFEEDKETKNTIRFREIVDEGEERIGTIYIKKSTLDELEYVYGDTLVVDLSRELRTPMV